MLKVALDFDNVLADTTGAWLRHYNKIYSKNTKKSDLYEYYFWNILNISRDEAFKIFYVVWTNWKDLPLLEKDSIRFVNSIAKIAEVDLVSSALVDMKDWIADKNLNFNKVIYTHEKSRFGYDIFIEDSPYEALKIIENRKMCLLYDQPWNKGVNASDRLIRINHLRDAVNFIGKDKLSER
jgi:5'(3')-deoxyribonucleotidase